MHRDVTILIAVPRPGIWREVIARHCQGTRAELLLVEAYSGRDLPGQPHRIHRPAQRLTELLQAGLEAIDTPYCQLVLPGDVPRLESIEPAWNYLERERDLVGCGGYAIAHRRRGNSDALRPELRRPRREPSGTTARARLVQAFADPEAALTRLYRTEFLRQAFPPVGSESRPGAAALMEPLLAALAAIAGPTAQLPLPYALIDPEAAHRTPSLDALAVEPHARQDLANFFRVVAGHLIAADGLDEVGARQVLDQAIAQFLEQAVVQRGRRGLLCDEALLAEARQFPGLALGPDARDLQPLLQTSRLLKPREQTAPSDHLVS